MQLQNAKSLSLSLLKSLTFSIIKQQNKEVHVMLPNIKALFQLALAIS